MELLANLQLGLSVAFTLENVGYCFLGAILGTLIGVLPGLGVVATIAMLLPVTFGLSPVSALIMLSGIYYGAQYGGSTTAILINLPGENSSVVTAIDGYKMAQSGRAGTALATAALGSFFAGCVATLVLALFAPPLSALALKFAAPEYFSLMVLGLIASVTLAAGSAVKALAMMVLGVTLGLVGQDIYTGMPRFTFGTEALIDGLDFVPIAMGLFGICEIVRNLEDERERSKIVQKVTGLILSMADFRRIRMPVLRGTMLGSFLGLLPGGGAMLSSFASYAIEKRLSRHPEEFGRGAIEGVAGPESANNAGAQTSFIPMLTLGIPSNPVMALMIGALIIQGIVPGPNVITNQPELFWGIIVSMWLGNAALVLLNLPLIGLWVRLLSVPYHLLFPIVIAICCIGAFSINSDGFDVLVMAGFGIFGYVLLKLDCEPAPLILGFVIGPMLEEYLRRALLLSHGDVLVFVTRPLSAVLLGAAVLALAVVLLPSVRKTREEAFKE